jgi:hypothetical protein
MEQSDAVNDRFPARGGARRSEEERGGARRSDPATRII